MQPSFGWTLLSRDALRRAETQLRDVSDGVRDEIGFLALHQAYADRFFPGTSVLHTRLRYALFVPWMYQRIAQQPDRKQVSTAVEKQELELTRRLKEAGEFGVIGKLNYPKPTAQPPSQTYWSALATWGILRPMSDDTIPSRQSVHRMIARKATRHQLHDDDGQLLTEDESLFSVIPPADAWEKPDQQLDFRLESRERRFLRNCLVSVERPQSNGATSLLARLVEQQLDLTDRMDLWSSKVKAAADLADREALIRARQAAALSAVGRGVYAALVEETRAKRDALPTENIHRANLDVVIKEFASDALALDVDRIIDDALLVPKGILEVLRATQIWLRSRTRGLASLFDVYELAEASRKGRRARLSNTLAAKERRAEWMPSEHSMAEPLHYRWKNVRQLLMDLQGAA